MSQKIRTKPKKNRALTYLWIFGLAALVFFLIWKEWTALLYIFATLGVTVLLIIVATADLGRSELSGDGASGPGAGPPARPIK